MSIFLALKYVTLISSMELSTGYLKKFPLEIGGRTQKGKSTYAMGRGVVACVLVYMMG